MEAFWDGFVKQASASDKAKAIAAIGAGGLGLAGLGALTGHLAHVSNKVDSARRGEDYRPKSFIEKHPKMTGAASLGLAPAFSAAISRRDKDMDSDKMRQVLKDHPFIGRAAAGHLS